MERCTSVPVPHFTRVWRKKPPIHYLLNRSCGSKLLLEQVQTEKISKACPHCLAADETTNHYIVQCPKWSAQKIAVFDSFYLSISEVIDDLSIFAILKFINSSIILFIYLPKFNCIRLSKLNVVVNSNVNF